jgi:adenine-specific DNA-methyltransferase
MPKGSNPKTARPKAASRSKLPKRTEDYRYPDKRTNNPEAGLQSFDRRVPAKVRYEYDPHLDPQLVWASKAEHTSFDVDTVSLHIHERISTQAILKTVQRESPQRGLFGDPELPLDKAVRFYEHAVGWANRLVLGDSLLVMNSLLHRELLGGKVQMIYIDPPYGVAYNSNFQPRIDRREVKDGADDSLTREPEQIKAYRDTWTLGVHSYLSYLRDRLTVARELLQDSGSVFVQISDENVHRVRMLMDEVFGAEHFCAEISFAKTTGASSPWAYVNVLATTNDFVIWYAKHRPSLKYRQLYWEKSASGLGGTGYSRVQLPSGERRAMSPEERENPSLLPSGSKIYSLDNLTSQGFSESLSRPFRYDGKTFSPGATRHWKTTADGLERLSSARRVQVIGSTPRYVRFLDDFSVFPITNHWPDTSVAGYSEVDRKSYVVQTAVKVITRCLLMTTDPGDLVFDPTCGSGTTAYVAEQWGRRWITCDTSRVALSLARQRLMTPTYPFYKLAYPSQGVAGGFAYEEVPHVTLKSIAQNLPAEPEKLYDQPEVLSGIVRVSGPFTVEAINTLDPEETLAFEPIEARARKDDIAHGAGGGTTVNDHLSEMTDLLRRDGGIHVPGTGRVEVDGIGRVTMREGIHAEGTIQLAGKPKRLAVAFGPRYGPVTARLVEEAIQASLGSYDALAVAGFSFDPEASAFLQKSPPSGLRFFRVQVAPDVLVGDLLKTPKHANLFAVIGEPDFSVSKLKDGLVVELHGVDTYDPNKNEVVSGKLDEVAAWFVDHDYDGRSFCVCQVFLPVEGGKGFEKLERALKGTVDEDAWNALRGFASRPIQPGSHKTIAVKVIDVRGNEVVGVRRLGR